MDGRADSGGQQGGEIPVESIFASLRQDRRPGAIGVNSQSVRNAQLVSPGFSESDT